MKLHANSPLGPKGRATMVRRVVEEGWSLTQAAEAAAVSERTCSKWVDRHRAEGEAGLADRSSAPETVANRTDEGRIEAIAALRRLRMTGAEIAECLAMAPSTVSGILTRIGLGKLSRLEPAEPPNRYERKHPGELIHIDVKRLGRIRGGAGHRIVGRERQRRNPTRTDRSGVRRSHVGYECVHVCVDDATRLAYVEVLADEKARTAIGFLKRAVAFYRAHGVKVERPMTDNGSAYRSAVHAIACRALGVGHIRTRPYRPRTNGKAERFIRTMLAGSIYNGIVYRNSGERAATLAGWLDFYNRRRRHGSLGHRSPIDRLNELQGNNVLGSYS
jgi:transposase InsO family protein